MNGAILLGLGSLLGQQTFAQGPAIPSPIRVSWVQLRTPVEPLGSRLAATRRTPSCLPGGGLDPWPWASQLPPLEPRRPELLAGNPLLGLSLIPGPPAGRRGSEPSSTDVPTRSTRLVDARVAPETKPVEDQARPRFRPSLELQSEWLSRASGVEILSYDIRVGVPLIPVFGPPPPSVRFGFSYTDLISDRSELPNELYDYGVDLSWIRRVNQPWTLRFQGGVVFATDGKNQTSDAWQFRGSALAFYQHDPKWTWVFGVVALGRKDLPAIPALGVTYRPSPKVEVQLVMPRPRVQLQVAERRGRQHWVHVGLELGGEAWAVERQQGTNDTLTYKEWRTVLGWDWVPKPEPGEFSAPGLAVEVQLGYSFARELEFDRAGPDISLHDALLLRVSISF